MVEIDLGDFFLNFPLPLLYRPYSGVTVKGLGVDLKKQLALKHEKEEGYWERC